MSERKRLPDRRASITLTFQVGGLTYTATISRYSDGGIGELFLNNHRSNSAADTNARDAAIVFSIAVQHGVNPELVRCALCRDSNGKASGPLGTALDIIMQEGALP
jgi:ribonucleoside-diphosphate reductase alpha chain